jgi:hypothetical protein
MAKAMKANNAIVAAIQTVPAVLSFEITATEVTYQT